MPAPSHRSAKGRVSEGKVRGARACAPPARRAVRGYRGAVFAFFSNRLGCIGSVAVSLVGTLLLLLLVRGCGGGF